MATPSTETRRTAVLRLPRARPLNTSERVRLAAEIVAAYLRARRELRRAPITAAVSRLRSETAAPHARQGAFAAPAEASLAASGSDLAASDTDPAPAQALEEARRLGRAVARTLALMPGDTRCLARSLVLTRLLARRGIPAKLVIGARSAPDFLAHAWVECRGEPVLPTGDGSFGRLVEL